MINEEKIKTKLLLTFGENFIANEKDFNKYKKDLQQANSYLYKILERNQEEFKEENNFIDNISFTTYLKWHKDYYEKIYNNWLELITNINKVVSVYFNDNIEKTYTAQEVKEILSDNDIYNLEKGFGGD